MSGRRVVVKKQAVLFAVALMLGSVVVVSTGVPTLEVARAAKGEPGPPPGKGGGGETPDYGDLIILYRGVNGVPIPSPEVEVPDPETGEMVDGGLCWQPIADVDFSYDGWTEPTDRVVVPTESTPVDGGWLIPVDQYNCAVEGTFSIHTQEVDFGRINEARSPAEVFATQLEDVVTKLAIADVTSLDPAGRMVASTCPTADATSTSTIDSPLQSLAVYRQLMLTGTIGTPLPQDADVLDTAARALGTASDKSGGVNVDMVAYLNAIMGLDDAPNTLLPKLYETYREEVQGVIQLVERSFLDYGAYFDDEPYEYYYDRAANFEALPSPPYIPADDATAGWFEYLYEYAPGYFQVERGLILEAVFGSGLEAGNIGGFAQASDDTRAVISFMHANPVPDTSVTPVPCTPGEGEFVDVSISDVSGLQVPKNVRDGSSDREFSVTVANAGPADATVTLTVTAIPAVEGTVEAYLGGDWVGSPFVFPEIVIEAGTSHTFSAFISIDIGQKTTIDWEAIATSEELDVNFYNNDATGVSSVKVTGGGGPRR